MRWDIAFVTWLHAMKLTSSTARLATLIYISPFISLVLIQQLVGEIIHWSSIAGLGLIVSRFYIAAVAAWKVPVIRKGELPWRGIERSLG